MFDLLTYARFYIKFTHTTPHPLMRTLLFETDLENQTHTHMSKNCGMCNISYTKHLKLTSLGADYETLLALDISQQRVGIKS